MINPGIVQSCDDSAFGGSMMTGWRDARYVMWGSWRMVDLLDALSGKELFVESYERSTSKRPTSAPSLHWMRRLVLLNGIRDRRRHWWLARTQAMLMRARTTVYSKQYHKQPRAVVPRIFTKCLANCLSRFLAPKPQKTAVASSYLVTWWWIQSLTYMSNAKTR